MGRGQSDKFDKCSTLVYIMLEISSGMMAVMDFEGP